MCQTSQAIGVERGLQAHFCGRQALNGKFELLQVFLKSTPDSLFECAHRRFPPPK